MQKEMNVQFSIQWTLVTIGRRNFSDVHHNTNCNSLILNEPNSKQSLTTGFPISSLNILNVEIFLWEIAKRTNELNYSFQDKNKDVITKGEIQSKKINTLSTPFPNQIHNVNKKTRKILDISKNIFFVINKQSDKQNESKTDSKPKILCQTSTQMKMWDYILVTMNMRKNLQ